MNVKMIMSNKFVILKEAIHKRCHHIQGGGSNIDEKLKVIDRRKSDNEKKIMSNKFVIL